jgi:non-canonical (house-cleaning) NTP pyrophosphatase
MDEVSGRKGVRENEGAFGILTRNRITRKESFKLALVCALAPIVNRDIYAIPDPRKEETRLPRGKDRRAD